MPDTYPLQPASRRCRSYFASGAVLRSLRASRGWTQDEAAAKAGLSERLIRKAEAGGAIELRSLAILAQLYTTAERRITPNHLLPVAGPAAPGPCEKPRPSSTQALVRRWFEQLWNQGRLSAVTELAAADCVVYAEGRVLRGRRAVRHRLAELRAAFSDLEVVIDECTGRGGLAVCRWRASMTHVGPWCSTSPSGKRLTVEGSSWMRFEHGLLREARHYWGRWGAEA